MVIMHEHPLGIFSDVSPNKCRSLGHVGFSSIIVPPNVLLRISPSLYSRDRKMSWKVLTESKEAARDMSADKRSRRSQSLAHVVPDAPVNLQCKGIWQHVLTGSLPPIGFPPARSVMAESRRNAVKHHAPGS